jgi:hypothetical protein
MILGPRCIECGYPLSQLTYPRTRNQLVVHGSFFSRSRSPVEFVTPPIKGSWTVCTLHERPAPALGSQRNKLRDPGPHLTRHARDVEEPTLVCHERCAGNDAQHLQHQFSSRHRLDHDYHDGTVLRLSVLSKGPRRHGAADQMWKELSSMCDWPRISACSRYMCFARLMCKAGKLSIC